jgi:poly [ADP-ribose] polymerase 2/3/4
MPQCEEWAWVPFLFCIIDVAVVTFHQVRRLDAAIRKEEKNAAAAAAATAPADGDGTVMDGEGNGGNKRKRKRTGDREEKGNGDASSEAVKLEGMGYRELQGLAKVRGIPANGGKKELLQRLLSAPAVAGADGAVQDKMEATTGLQTIFYSLKWTA